MDVEMQRRKFHQNAIKIELPAERHVFSVMLYWDHMANKLTELRFWHYHVWFEVLCAWEPGEEHSARFMVVPPRVRHNGALSGIGKASFMTTFQFAVRELPRENQNPMITPNRCLETFLKLKQPAEVPDTFGGLQKLQQIRREMAACERRDPDELYFLFQRLLIDLAKAMPCYRPQKTRSHKYTVQEFAPELIERYLMEHYAEPDCCREQLAEIICISNRHLGRILEQIHGKTFRTLLTEYRMEIAEAQRLRDGLSARENAEQVGYASTQGFLNAYRQYFGREYGTERT